MLSRCGRGERAASVRRSDAEWSAADRRAHISQDGRKSRRDKRHEKASHSAVRTARTVRTTLSDYSSDYNIGLTAQLNRFQMVLKQCGFFEVRRTQEQRTSILSTVRPNTVRLRKTRRYPRPDTLGKHRPSLSAE